jgi:hypothetical protein
MVDVSRNVVAILVVLVIVVSGFGTWSLLNERSQSPAYADLQPSNPVSDAAVSVTIERPARVEGTVSLAIGEPGAQVDG